MKEGLNIIFTHQSGQEEFNVPMTVLELTSALSSKERLEGFTRTLWWFISEVEKITGLRKVSTCLYTDGTIPDWYGDWDGKFEYPDKLGEA